VFALYADVRATADPEAAWRHWRATRDDLFREHPQSPLPPAARESFAGLQYYPYDPAHRVAAELLPLEAPPQPVETSGEAPLLFRPFALASFTLAGVRHELEAHWLEGYGGGIFLPVRDATSAATTYGGGRYVLDTVKGADLGADDGRLIVDFNFAYNPSCAYDPGWVCPLAPPGNRLAAAIEAGERMPW